MSGPALQARPFRNFPSPLLLFASCCGLSRMTFDPPIFLPIPPFVCVGAASGLSSPALHPLHAVCSPPLPDSSNRYVHSQSALASSAAGAPRPLAVPLLRPSLQTRRLPGCLVVESRAAGSPHAPPHAARAEKAAERQKAERRASGKALSATAPRSTGWRAGSRRMEGDRVAVEWKMDEGELFHECLARARREGQ